jgi:hypothetical protein
MVKSKLVDALTHAYVEQGDGSWVHPDFVGRKVGPKSVEEAIAEIEKRAFSMMSMGFCLVCSFCHNLWEAHDAGLSSCSIIGCSGPKKMGDFPMYRGELPRHLWGKWCMVCGAEATVGFRPKGNGVVFGLCSSHKSMFIDKEIGNE